MNPYVQPGAAYGVKENRDEWNAGKCISGEPVWKDLEEDKDLARATRFGFTN